MPYLIIGRRMEVEYVEHLVGSRLDRAKKDVSEGWARVVKIGPTIKEMRCPNGISYEWVGIENGYRPN